ncbi:Signal recognition particle 19 kDa protein [Dichanthelium oligosanthes]|uniref:Signal recognition particle 19 kDa protein n=1 Tax=Dichanthelium oligosanthes TaxID=888268 RepID=A0A1E5W677_9POAL|nr:Signal recognition particle 19 kDa protein [Dichanthelium oligosanthes]
MTCPDPTCAEIADCCSRLKIPCKIESDKAYPRDFLQVGRVRVQLKWDDGSPVNPEITTSEHQLSLRLLFFPFVSVFVSVKQLVSTFGQE